MKSLELVLLSAAVIDAGGPKAVGLACGVSYQAVQKWMKHGLPRTEYSGETDYASKICQLGNALHSRQPLLDETQGQRRNAQDMRAA